MGDEELIRRIRQGEKKLLDLLIERYYQDVFRFCYYRTGNEQTAYDCTQETFLRMLRFLGNCGEARNFKSYLLRIALNICRDYYRDNPGFMMPLNSEEDMVFIAGKHHTSMIHKLEDAAISQNIKAEEHCRRALSDYTQIEDKYIIQKCLMRLPEFQREAIVLHFYYGYKLREIASVTGVSLPTAKSRLKQGLDKLKKIFREEGICEEDW